MAEVAASLAGPFAFQQGAALARHHCWHHTRCLRYSRGDQLHENDRYSGNYWSLYTLFLPVLVFALLGSSRHLVVSADSATAAMIAALTTLSFTANSPRYIELTSTVALVTAGLLLLARILRLGFLADFLSRAVLVGFLTGVGVQVAGGELHEMLGIETRGHGFLMQFFTLSGTSERHVSPVFSLHLAYWRSFWDLNSGPPVSRRFDCSYWDDGNQCVVPMG